MNQPWIYMYSPSRSPLPPPSPPDPSGSAQCTRPEHLSHASNLGWWSVSPLIVYLFQFYSLRTSHPRLLPLSPKVCSVYLCLFFCFTYRVIIALFIIDRTWKHPIVFWNDFCYSLWNAVTDPGHSLCVPPLKPPRSWKQFTSWLHVPVTNLACLPTELDIWLAIVCQYLAKAITDLSFNLENANIPLIHLFETTGNLWRDKEQPETTWTTWDKEQNLIYMPRHLQKYLG